MARPHGHGKLSNKQTVKTPAIYLDKENNFASIRLAKGVEAQSYEKTVFVFSEFKRTNH